MQYESDEYQNALGRLKFPDNASALITDCGFSPLPIGINHAEQAGNLPLHHTDPFDRMLIAQSQIEGFTLASIDQQFGAYDVKLLL